jgi:hypothetical protein
MIERSDQKVWDSEVGDKSPDMNKKRERRRKIIRWPMATS